MITDGPFGLLVDLAFLACGIALLVLLYLWFAAVRQRDARQAVPEPGPPALVAVDLPLEAADALPFSPVVANATRLAAEFRERGLAVALSRVEPETPPRVRVAQSGDLLVSTPVQSAFAVTDLNERLRSRGVGRVVLAGLAGGSGIEATARHAYDLGYRVVIAADAVDETFTERSVLGYADVSPTQDVLALLAAQHGPEAV